MKGILPVYLLMIVVDRGKAAKAARFLQEYSCPVQLILNGHGTASSKIMDYLGLDEPQKEIIISMAAGECASVILKRLEKEMNFSRPGLGIACSLPLSGITKALSVQLENTPATVCLPEEELKMKVTLHHELILSIVDNGMSDLAMEAAKQAGSKGGTVCKARSIYSEEVKRIFGMTLQQEKEILMILVPAEKKLPVMEAINSTLSSKTGERGIVFSLPVHEVFGLKQ